MKKYSLIIAVVVAAAVACTKEFTTDSAVQAPQNGVRVSFTVGQPELGEVDENGNETKITESVSGTTHKFQWEEGDQITLWAFNKPTATGQTEFIKIGDFTAEESGAQVKFSGTLPDTLGKLGYMDIFALYNAGSKADMAKSTSTGSAPNIKYRYTIQNVFVSPEQDGTGFKSCQFAAIGWTLSYTKEGEDSTATGINTNDNKFFLSDVMFKINTSDLSENIKITKIIIRNHYEGTQALYITGFCNFISSSTEINSAGNSRTVTIYNGGEELPETVYAATRHTVAGEKYGNATMYFTFFYTENGVSKIATKSISGIDGSTSKPNFKARNIYTFKIKSLSGKAAQSIEWTASKTNLIVAPNDSTSYTNFPYANSSSGNGVSKISDGKDGSTLVSGKYYTVERPYVFPTGTDSTTLTVGAVGSTGYYYYPKDYSHIRMQDGYIIIPAREGYRLAGLRMTSSNKNFSSSKKYVYVCTDLNDYENTTIDDFQAVPYDITAGFVFNINWNFTSTQANTPYYIYINEDRLTSSFIIDYVAVD